MDRPGWAEGVNVWAPSRDKPKGEPAKGSKPLTLYSFPPRRSGEVEERGEKSTSSPRPSTEDGRLGKTEGIFAAGAWAAREELASLLEDGIAPDELVAEIRAGHEGEHRLGDPPKKGLVPRYEVPG